MAVATIPETEMIKLIGNVVLLEPLPDGDIQKSSSGIFLVNRHKKATLKYRVIAVGPGGWRYRKGRRKCFVVPEVAVGECVLCRALLDDGVVKHSFDDGTGRVIVHSEGILASWRQP